MIKLFLTDCDGVLTNGIYYRGVLFSNPLTSVEKPILYKGFYTRDFHGMQGLHNSGVKIGIVTYSKDSVIKTQCKIAPYVMIFSGIEDKKSYVSDKFITVEDGYNWDEIAYMGDDIIDTELLAAVGRPSCPCDAHLSVLQQVTASSNGYVSDYKGGEGCVRQFCDSLVRANKIER